MAEYDPDSELLLRHKIRKAMNDGVSELKNAVESPSKAQTLMGAFCFIVSGYFLNDLVSDMQRHIDVSRSHNAVVVSDSNNVTINKDRNMRQWRDVPAEERAAIKADAFKRFPEIQDIGSGVRWRPVAEWMAEEKGVAVSNVRDLFR